MQPDRLKSALLSYPLALPPSVMSAFPSTTGKLRIINDKRIINQKMKYKRCCVQGTASMIYVYARPVTKYNQECLRRWLTVDNCETTTQLAFAIQLQLTNSEFSASKLILDLPGSASLIDPIPYAIDAPVDTDCLTSINIDAGELKSYCFFFVPHMLALISDTNTATVFDDKDYRCALRIQEEKQTRFVSITSI